MSGPRHEPVDRIGAPPQRHPRLPRRALAPLTTLALLAAAPVLHAQDPAPKSAVHWSLLKPTRLASNGGATFTPQPDGSIVVSGKSAEKEVYRLEFDTDLATMTGLRLEALADPALPQGGPGRAANGNFVLNEMKVESWTKLQVRSKPVPLQNASADFIEAGRWPAQVCDAIEDAGGNGWAVFGAVGKDHELVVETVDDVKLEGAGRLEVELVFNWGAQHTLGRFRLSATGDARPFSVAGAGVDSWPKMQERINLAIDRGVAWLVEHQELDGSWNHELTSYRCGATALSTYTLLKSGVPPKHPAVVRAVEFLKCQPTKETYSIGCELLALGALDDPANEPWIQSLAETLLSFHRGGLFNYPWANCDLSNTQYGVLGMRAAAQHGFKVPPDFWEKTAQAVLSLSTDEGSGAYAPLGFHYNATTKPTGSMTAAGAVVLAICDEQLNGKGKSGSLQTFARRGAEWIGANWQVAKNPREAVDRWNIYYLYGVERVGSLLKTELMGRHKWYREGATALVEMQGAKGEWTTSYREPVPNTCFALLFLNKATAVASGTHSTRSKIWGDEDPKAALSLRASGDTPLSLWIARIGDQALVDREWPNEEGRGPRARRVEYVATGFKDRPGEVVLATVERDGAQPCGRERFAAQYSFPLPGNYTIFARMTVVAPPDREGNPPRIVAGSEPHDVTLASPPVEVKIEEALDPELLQYARDPARNLLSGQRLTISASSVINGDWQAAFACDNLQARGWACDNKDTAPSLKIELEKPVRATTILVTPAKIGEKYDSRITKLSITLNGKGPPLDVDVPQTPERCKVRVRLAQPQVVRRLDVKVTGVALCANAEKAVGLAEVELQADKPGEKESP
jgi:hypothetical protein